MYFLFFYPDTVTSLTFLFGRLVPYQESSVALFQHLSNRELLLVRTCAVAFCLQTWPFLLGSRVLHSPEAMLPGKAAGLSVTHSQGNRLSLSSCFSEPGHTVLVMRQRLNNACVFAYADNNICCFPVQCLTLPWNVFKTLSMNIIYFNRGVFGRIDRREGR